MGNVALDNKILSTISLLAEQLKTSREEIIKKAVASYAKKINQKDSLMKFAGILDEKEADGILNTIYDNRKNKIVEPRL